MHNEQFRPGDRVPCSGVYQVSHHEHRSPHEATLAEGGVFPACSICGPQTTFRLLKPAAEAKSDKDVTQNG